MSSIPPPHPDHARLSEVAQALRPQIAAYPGSITYLDLIARNKRASAILIVFMILLAVVLGVVIAALLTAYFGRGRVATPRDLLPSMVLGGLAALVTAILATTWSWYGGAGAILAMTGANEITQADDPELFNVVDEVRIAAGLPMPRVFLIPETALNAFSTGRDPEHAAVAITTALRQRLTRDELQGVMAHEVAHIRHYDIRFALLMATMVGLIVFACDAFFRIGFRGGWSRGSSRESGKGGGGAVLVVLLILAVILAMIAPILAQLIQMAYSRQREYLADAGAVELTRNPEGLASALSRLANDPDPLVDRANRGTAHMFIVNPLRQMAESRQSLDTIFSSHPPLDKRIARLLALTR